MSYQDMEMRAVYGLTLCELMEKDKNGVWTKTIKLEPGSYLYKFVVDGNWVADPFGKSAGDDYGNSIIEVE